MYKINDYDYNLPKSLISQKPASQRDSSRLLRMRRKSGLISHHSFKEIDKFFRPSDILVINDTKVIPGKIFGKKKSGGKFELLILNFGGNTPNLSEKNKVFKCLIKASNRSSIGTILLFELDLEAIILDFSNGIYFVKFSDCNLLEEVIYKFGHLPLPHYIKRSSNQNNNIDDGLRYQTIYANKPGAIAAPTAGLHITKNTIKSLKSIGVKIVSITLHVGYGTFSPIRVNDVRKHKMHSEWFSINYESAKTITNGKEKGCRIIAVGTTCVRTLEFVMSKKGEICETSGDCDLFIYPGYNFKIVNAMITNFHLPCSTLIMLVSAFSSKDKILNAYNTAVNKQYKFFSYGDAMLID